MIRPFSSATLAALGLSLLTGPFSGMAQDKEGGKPRVWEKKDREKIQAWESLSPEQREKLREALRGVWTDPAVINAREEVKHATEAYQAAIKAAVERADPTVSDLLSKVQGSGMMALPPDGPNGPGSSGTPGGASNRGFDQQIRPPGFLDGLSPEARVKFRKTEEEAMNSDAVKAARSELDRIRGEDEALRRERVEAHRKLRKVTVEEMIRIDPSIAAMQKRLLDGGRPSGNGEKKKETDAKEKKSSGADPVPKTESGGEGERGKAKE